MADVFQHIVLCQTHRLYNHNINYENRSFRCLFSRKTAFSARVCTCPGGGMDRGHHEPCIAFEHRAARLPSLRQRCAPNIRAAPGRWSWRAALEQGQEILGQRVDLRERVALDERH